MARGCFCIAQVVSVPPSCGNCLRPATYRFGGADSILPCGGEIEINLAEDSITTASPCNVVYSLVSYDTTAFAEVVVEADGTMTVTSADIFERGKEYLITYKIDSPCSILSAVGEVYISFKDPCAGQIYTSDKYCNECGEIVDKVSDMEILKEGIGYKTNGIDLV